MGLFDVTIAVGNKDGGDLHEVDVTVDTGAFHTVLPASLMAQLSVEPIDEEPIVFGNGSTEVWSVGEARIGYAGRQRTCLVLFSPAEERLLGATTLEAFRLMVDPVHKVLSPAPSLRARPI